MKTFLKTTGLNPTLGLEAHRAAPWSAGAFFYLATLSKLRGQLLPPKFNACIIPCILKLSCR